MLPQDIVDNTVKAFDVSATSATGYGANGAPTGRYLAPANGPDCIEIAQSNVSRPHTGYGDCGAREVVVTGPPQVRFDLGVVKRVPIVGRVRARVPRRDAERVQQAVVRAGRAARQQHAVHDGRQLQGHHAGG